MKALVCYKWVYDEEDVRVTGGEVDTSRAKTKLNLYDKNAIEAAVVAAGPEGECVALSFGGEEASSSKKEVLSRGPQRGYVVKSDAARQADAYVTANVLAAAIRRIGDVDLIVTAEGASDDYDQQVGPRIAQALGIPVVAYATDVQVDGATARVERAVDEGIETLEVKLPAVVSMQGDCNSPAIPTLKKILAAGKKPFEEIPLEELGLADEELTARMRTVGASPNEQDRKTIRIEGDAAAQAEELLRCLIQESVL